MSDKRVNLDPESRAIIFQGASATQLGRMFHMNPADVQQKLRDLEPVGTGRQGNPLYDIRSAAERIIRPPITYEAVDQYMRSVNHSHLPPMVSKFYWDGKLARDRYLKQANELWHTEDVVRVAGETFQALRMSLMLLPDLLRDETQLNETQFQIVQRTVDEILEGARVRIIDNLRPEQDSDGPGSEEEDGEL